MNAGDVLDAAADYIDEHGHCKGDYWSPSGAVCLRGALIVATGDLEVRTEAYLAVYERVGRSPISWNDDATTTHELVTKTMRAAADDLRAKESA